MTKPDYSQIQLVAPAGSREKLVAALYFGADAVYLGGRNFSLRAFADNFDDQGLTDAVQLVHTAGRKAFVTLNIFAHQADLSAIADYISFLSTLGIDGLIVSDLGVFDCAQRLAPNLPLHISTQANVTNHLAAARWAQMGASRIVLAREVSLCDIRLMRDRLPDNVALEAFVHGAMCVSYSGRCLLSNALTGRGANQGECAQPCRWRFRLVTDGGQQLPIDQDDRNTYILNSRDLCMISHLDKLADAGVSAFKVEGRTKSIYYVASVVGAYRRAVDILRSQPEYVVPQALLDELPKTAHRPFGTGFYFGDDRTNISIDRNQANGTHEFVALVTAVQPGRVQVEQRNRFAMGDTLQVLSPGPAHNQCLRVQRMTDTDDQPVTDARLVQQLLWIDCDLPLAAGDILRRKIT